MSKEQLEQKGKQNSRPRTPFGQQNTLDGYLSFYEKKEQEHPAIADNSKQIQDRLEEALPDMSPLQREEIARMVAAEQYAARNYDKAKFTPTPKELADLTELIIQRKTEHPEVTVSELAREATALFSVAYEAYHIQYIIGKLRHTGVAIPTSKQVKKDGWRQQVQELHSKNAHLTVRNIQQFLEVSYETARKLLKEVKAEETVIFTAPQE